MTRLQPADLDRLEQLAREADELRWTMTDWWYPPSALLDVDARLIAALDPAVVSELVAAARLGAAWRTAEEALPEGWRGPSVGPGKDDCWRAFAWQYAKPHTEPIEGVGPTPAAALLSLAETLREQT